MYMYKLRITGYVHNTGLVENVGEGENAALSSLRAIYPFPTVFFQRLVTYYRDVKTKKG